MSHAPYSIIFDVLLTRYSDLLVSKMNRNYDKKHLSNGDKVLPSLSRLRLYNMRLCPYAQRTILALNAKKVDYELINVDLQNKPEWLFDKNPFGTVPVLELHNGITIYDSLLIVDYLDEVYPQNPLFRDGHITNKIIDKQLVKSAEPIERLYLKLFKWPDQVTEADVIAYHKCLKFIQDKLTVRRTKFLGGFKPGYADFMIWPWFERYLAFDDDERVRIDKTKYERLTKYIEDMYLDPVVSSYLTPKEPLDKLHKQFALGTFNINEKFVNEV